MLLGLAIRDVVLIDQLDLSIGPGLTALTGETGAGKSIVLDALGLASGARAEAGLVRRGAAQAMATASFAPAPDHAVWALLDEKGLSYARDEDLVLRRSVSADGRSRAFVNDQPTSVGVLRELGELLLEVHGQHETVGLLDAKTHRRLLDEFGGLGGELAACAEAWSRWRAARERAERLSETAGRAQAEAEELTLRLSELDRLDPREGEETELAEERAILGAAEKALTDISAAREGVSADLTHKLAQGYRALDRARERTIQAGASAESAAVTRIAEAAAAVDRALVEATEAQAAIDAAADAFDFQPDRLEKAEERLFAIRAMARKLSLAVDDLPAARARFARELGDIENLDEALRQATAEAAAAEADFRKAAESLTRARRAAGDRLAKAVEAELGPLKLDKARFRVAVEPLAEDRAGPSGADRIEFEVATNPGAPFGGLAVIASGGELARFALALKVCLAARERDPPLMIFDEVDQGVGGAVADAVGLRLRRLAERAQVLVVTHSPQVAARADAHWRVLKAGEGDKVHTAIEVLTPAAREDEIARMLAGAQITEAARAAARALIA
ncbi:MAG TPA: DNA repair protein RecN [Caulobacteraceae bacterium]|nr:DNA repair protein RecN [Caulobacteraceae bacterium]